MSTTVTPEAIETFRESVNPACYQAICDAFESDQPGLVDALPAQGKSRGLVLWAAEHQKPLTVYTLRHDLYRQFEASCAELGLNYIRVPSHLADCPLGKHYEVTHGKEPLADPEEWEKTFKDGYKKWGSAVAVHGHYGNKLPCQMDGPCPYIRSREGFHRLLEEVEDGNATPYDVIIGNYLHAHSTYGNRVPGRYTKGRYVAFDEFPGEAAITKFDSGEFQRSVSAYLKTETALPFNNYGTLANEGQAPEHEAAIEEWRTSLTRWDEFDAGIGRQQSGVSPLAPLLTEAALDWWCPANGYCRAQVGRDYVVVKDGDDGNVWILRRPRIRGIAESVIALDGTPTMALWNAILPEIEHFPVFPTDAEKRTYLRDELGLRIIQTWRYIKPYASGVRFDPEETENQFEGVNKAATKDMLALRWIIETESRQEAPGLITTKKALEAYEREGVLDLVGDAEYYNNLIGMNDFEETRFGIVVGCNYPGDDVVKMWAALCGYFVEAKRNEDGKRIAGVNLDFGERGNSLLHAVRENDVLQAVMRFGRKVVAGDRGATVYVHTAALPEWVQPEMAVPRVRLWSGSDGMTQVLSVLLDDNDLRNGEWTVTHMAETVTDAFDKDAKSRKSIKRALDDLSEMSPPLLANEQRTGPGSGRGSGYVYWNLDLERLLEHELGYVLPPPE